MVREEGTAPQRCVFTLVCLHDLCEIEEQERKKGDRKSYAGHVWINC